jgi:3-oxoacyl-[acyl-carrier protein] reductase
VALVTGAGQGIGLAIARRLATAGASVAIADVNEPGAREAAHGVVAEGMAATAFVCDVSKRNSVEHMVDDVLTKYGHIDILVNNAGIDLPHVPIQEQTDDYWNQIIAVNLTGVFHCCRAVIPHMIERKTGRIVNISSIAGMEGRPNQVSYCSSKAGVVGLTKALAREVAQHNIFVNTITPALIVTPLSSKIPPEEIKKFIEPIPLSRPGKPEEVAAVVHWLASDEASFTTGAVFNVTGGRATY